MSPYAVCVLPCFLSLSLFISLILRLATSNTHFTKSSSSSYRTHISTHLPHSYGIHFFSLSRSSQFISFLPSLLYFASLFHFLTTTACSCQRRGLVSRFQFVFFVFSSFSFSFSFSLATAGVLSASSPIYRSLWALFDKRAHIDLRGGWSWTKLPANAHTIDTIFVVSAAKRLPLHDCLCFHYKQMNFFR